MPKVDIFPIFVTIEPKARDYTFVLLQKYDYV